MIRDKVMDMDDSLNLDHWNIEYVPRVCPHCGKELSVDNLCPNKECLSNPEDNTGWSDG